MPRISIAEKGTKFTECFRSHSILLCFSFAFSWPFLFTADSRYAKVRRFERKGRLLSLRRAKITAVSHYLPERRITNKDLENIIDTSDEWIVDRTGIRERRMVEKGQATSDMGAAAAKRLCEKRGLDPAELDLIIVATVTPDMFFPSTACLVQTKIGAKKAWGFDLSGACSGFVYALATGAQFVVSGTHNKVLVIGADVMTSIVDFQDRGTCVLFGDGAGAVLLEPAEEGER